MILEFELADIWAQDTWFWDRFKAITAAASRSYAYNTPYPASGSPATLRLRCSHARHSLHATNPNHRVTVGIGAATLGRRGVERSEPQGDFRRRACRNGDRALQPPSRSVSRCRRPTPRRTCTSITGSWTTAGCSGQSTTRSTSRPRPPARWNTASAIYLEPGRRLEHHDTGPAHAADGGDRPGGGWNLRRALPRHPRRRDSVLAADGRQLLRRPPASACGRQPGCEPGRRRGHGHRHARVPAPRGRDAGGLASGPRPPHRDRRPAGCLRRVQRGDPASGGRAADDDLGLDQLGRARAGIPGAHGGWALEHEGFQPGDVHDEQQTQSPPI